MHLTLGTPTSRFGTGGARVARNRYKGGVTWDLSYLLFGTALLLAVVLPVALRRIPLSPPAVLVAIGCLIGLLPFITEERFSPIEHRVLVEHLAELTVLVALMGVGLAMDRPLSLRRPRSWGTWSVTWRLLGITMPLSIAAVAWLGWWAMGLGPAAALLLGAALAPTDPVLAGDVQVAGPAVGTASAGASGDGADGSGHDHLDESDEVRFALTSEAGLNDSLAFPFVYAAILLATQGAVGNWGWHWLGWYLVGKVAIGLLAGALVGWVLGKVAFSARRESLRVAERGEPLLAVATLIFAYGVAEMAQGYGFLSVFVAAMTLRSLERGHAYHEHMHGVIERLEQLLTLALLLMLGVSLTNGLLANLTLGGVVVGLALVLVVRPLSGWLALLTFGRGERMGRRVMTQPEKVATGFFGVRGVGSIYYLAYATGYAAFAELPQLWSTVGFTVTLSVIVHGVTATPVMDWIERHRPPPAAEPGPELQQT